MTERKFAPPFLIQMDSGDTNRHCDIYPHGSIHEVKKCEEGHLWLTDRIDSIPDTFGTKVLENKPETKKCPDCRNEFPKDWPFVQKITKNETIESCIRCYEKVHFTNREKYREALRNELKMELNKI